MARPGRRYRPTTPEMHEDEAIRALHGENSRYLTEQDVKEALLLRQKGEQRLPVVSDSETTWFYFAVSSDEHYGATEICVSPQPRHNSQNPFYHPSCRYTLCCDEARADVLKDQQQAVYDGRIRPSQWKFGNDSVKVPLSVRESRQPCREKLWLGFKVLSETRANRQDGSFDSNTASPDNEGCSGTRPTAESQQASTDGEAQRPRQRSHIRPDLEKEDGAGEVEPPKKRRVRRSDEAIADCVAKKIIGALKLLRARTTKAIITVDINIIRAELKQSSGERRDYLLEKMADQLWDSSHQTQEDSSAVWWAERFYSSCMRYILRKRRKIPRDDAKDRASDATHTINLTVNNLCSNGCGCGQIVYAAMAVMKHTINEMGDKGPDRRSKFSILLADKVRDKVPDRRPEVTEVAIFNPALYISLMWNEPYDKICEALGLHNLIGWEPPSKLIRVYGTFAPEQAEPAGRPYTLAVPYSLACPTHIWSSSVEDQGTGSTKAGREKPRNPSQQQIPILGPVVTNISPAARGVEVLGTGAGVSIDELQNGKGTPSRRHSKHLQSLSPNGVTYSASAVAELHDTDTDTDTSPLDAHTTKSRSLQGADCHSLHAPLDSAQDSTYPDSFSPLDGNSTGQFRFINAGKHGRNEPTATGQSQGMPTDQVTRRKRRRMSRGGREESTSEASLPAPPVGAGRLPSPQAVQHGTGEVRDVSEDSLEDHLASQSVLPGPYTVENAEWNFPGTNLLDDSDPLRKVGQHEAAAPVAGSSGGPRTCLHCGSHHGFCIHALIDVPHGDGGARMSASGSTQLDASVRVREESSLQITHFTASRGDLVDTRDASKGRLRAGMDDTCTNLADDTNKSLPAWRHNGTVIAEQRSGGLGMASEVFFTDPSALSPCPVENAASVQILDTDLPSHGTGLDVWTNIFEPWLEPLGVFELQ